MTTSMTKKSPVTAGGTAVGYVLRLAVTLERRKPGRTYVERRWIGTAPMWQAVALDGTTYPKRNRRRDAVTDLMNHTSAAPA